MKKLFAFGLGFASRLAVGGWQIAGTTRDEANLARAVAQGYGMARFAGEAGNREVTKLLQGTTHLIHSIPPGPHGDPVLAHYRDQIATIGDMPNDVPMLSVAGHSIAMGNASPEVQRVARHVTSSNEEEGFAEAVESFILGEPPIARTRLGLPPRARRSAP